MLPPFELRIRREALGLSQTELAERLGTTQVVISTWESGRRSPRDPISVKTLLQDLGDAFTDIVDETIDNLENASGKLDGPEVAVRVYENNTEYWAADARAAQLEIPASLHRHAVGVAILLAETEIGVSVVVRSSP